VSFFSHMLTEEVDREPIDSFGTDGQPTYGTKSTGLDARVKRNIRENSDTGGTSGDTATVVWLEAEEVQEGDRLHLPDGTVLDVQSTSTVKTTDGRLSLYRAEG